MIATICSSNYKSSFIFFYVFASMIYATCIHCSLKAAVHVTNNSAYTENTLNADQTCVRGPEQDIVESPLVLATLWRKKWKTCFIYTAIVMSVSTLVIMTLVFILLTVPRVQEYIQDVFVNTMCRLGELFLQHPDNMVNTPHTLRLLSHVLPILPLLVINHPSDVLLDWLVQLDKRFPGLLYKPIYYTVIRHIIGILIMCIFCVQILVSFIGQARWLVLMILSALTTLYGTLLLFYY